MRNGEKSTAQQSHAAPFALVSLEASVSDIPVLSVHLSLRLRGFMLIFWNMAGVPFTYCYNTLYLLKQYEAGHPVYLSWTANAALCVVLLSAYYGQCKMSDENALAAIGRKAQQQIETFRF